jgi:hypothetical protein
VISDDFCEWTEKAKQRRPYGFHRPDNALIVMAGVWHWQQRPEGFQQTFAIYHDAGQRGDGADSRSDAVDLDGRWRASVTICLKPKNPIKLADDARPTRAIITTPRGWSSESLAAAAANLINFS